LKYAYDIFVLTSNTDLDGPLAIEKTNEWIAHPAGGFKVCYLTKENQGYRHIYANIKKLAPDFVYLNSMFSVRFALLPLFIKMVYNLDATFILAPRGMLKSSALAFKSLKKQVFLFFFRLFRWHKMVRFQATDPIEYRDIVSIFGSVNILELTNFPGFVAKDLNHLQKKEGELSLLFVGRIHPIKNLHLLLKSLQTVKGKIILNIVGVMENQEYWDQCKLLIHQLAASIEVKYLGDLEPEPLNKIYQSNQVFVLPTQGENFGHAIFDAFANGKPVLISDQTPWKGLESKKAGWDLGLSDFNHYSEKIQVMLEWPNEIYQEWSNNAHQLALDFVNNSDLVNSYNKLFQ
jgi:glycosyltransferase involved in cell wall biosynthesis